MKKKSEFKAIGGKEKSNRAEKYIKEDSGAVETYSHSNERQRIEKMISQATSKEKVKSGAKLSRVAVGGT